MMKYYKVVLSGENIFFENACRIDCNAPEPVIGFIACKLIQTDNRDLAIAIAKRDLLVQWNQSFNLDRKLGMPKLAVEFIAEMRGWFKPKTTNDYYWFTDLEHKQLQLDIFTQPPRQWFRRSATKKEQRETES